MQYCETKQKNNYSQLDLHVYGNICVLVIWLTGTAW